MKHVARSAHARSYHAVRFYENEKSLAQIVAEFLAVGLEDGQPGIVVATPAQRGSIIRELVVRGVDVVSMQRSADLVLLDAQDTLSSFMTGATLDASTFNDVMTAIIKRVCRERANCTVRIYG